MSNFYPLEVVNRGSETQLAIDVIPYLTFRKKEDINPMLGQCWYSVCDAVPALTQHWMDVWMDG